MSDMPKIKSAEMQLGPTDRSLPIALLRAREAVMGPVREMLARSHISEQKWRVLRVLAESGPLEQSAIAAQASLLLPSLTRILRSMEQEHLISRAAGATDRRKTIVTISDAGQKIIAEHAAESKALVAEIKQKFGDDDLDQLLSLLEKLQRVI